MMKKRRCGNSEVQTIRGNASEERVIEIKVAHHHGFTVEFCIKEDPNEEAAQAHSVLFGIIQAENQNDGIMGQNRRVRIIEVADTPTLAYTLIQWVPKYAVNVAHRQ